MDSVNHDDVSKLTLPSFSQKSQEEEELIRRYLGVTEDFNVNTSNNDDSLKVKLIKISILAGLLTCVYGIFCNVVSKLNYFTSPLYNKCLLYGGFFIVALLILTFYK